MAKEEIQFSEKVSRPFTGSVYCEECGAEVKVKNKVHAGFEYCECGKRILIQVEG